MDRRRMVLTGIAVVSVVAGPCLLFVGVVFGMADTFPEGSALGAILAPIAHVGFVAGLLISLGGMAWLSIHGIEGFSREPAEAEGKVV